MRTITRQAEDLDGWLEERGKVHGSLLARVKVLVSDTKREAKAGARSAGVKAQSAAAGKTSRAKKMTGKAATKRSSQTKPSSYSEAPATAQ